jgi:cytochrome c oxidase subunit 3
VSATELFTDERAVRGTSSPVMGMVLFVAGEAMFFAALFGAYFSVRTSASVWPPKSIGVPELAVPSVLTVILVTSSVVLQIGVAAVRSGRIDSFRNLLGLTILLGLCFLALQAYDYSQLGFGLKDGVFGSLFYVMTGIHMAHVIGGVVFLSLVFVQLVRGGLSAERHDPLSAGAIYWDFVDVVWLCLFTVFYLLGPR